MLHYVGKLSKYLCCTVNTPLNHTGCFNKAIVMYATGPLLWEGLSVVLIAYLLFFAVAGLFATVLGVDPTW